MISPNTPPGTEIVCIDARLIHLGPSDGFAIKLDLDGLTEGYVYTVREIVADEFDRAPVVRLAEIYRPISGDETEEVGYALARFRYLNLAGLDALLNAEEKEPEHA